MSSFNQVQAASFYRTIWYDIYYTYILDCFVSLERRRKKDYIGKCSIEVSLSGRIERMDAFGDLLGRVLLLLPSRFAHFFVPRRK